MTGEPVPTYMWASVQISAPKDETMEVDVELHVAGGAWVLRGKLSADAWAEFPRRWTKLTATVDNASAET